MRSAQHVYTLLSSPASRQPSLGIERVLTIDLVLIDQQSVGKRSLYLMGNVNVKKRWSTVYWYVNNFDREPHSDPPC
jgi:hypothetical protein